MNRGWHFLPNVPAGGHDAALNETATARLTVPHTNKMLPWHNFDDADCSRDGLAQERAFHPLG